MFSKPEMSVDGKFHKSPPLWKGFRTVLLKPQPGGLGGRRRQSACPANPSMREVCRKIPDDLLFLWRKLAAELVGVQARRALGFRQQTELLDFTVHYRPARAQRIWA